MHPHRRPLGWHRRKTGSSRTDSHKDVFPERIGGIPYNINTVERAIEVYVGRIHKIKQLNLVGPFLAAVQAQLLAFTYLSNGTPVEKAINTLFFVGLVLDIVGTSAGLLKSETYHRSMKSLVGMRETMSRMPETHRRIKELEQNLQEDCKEEFASLLKEEKERMKLFNHLRPLLARADLGVISKKDLDFHNNDRKGLNRSHSSRYWINLSAWYFVVIVKPTKKLIPDIAMISSTVMLGIYCFLSGVCLFTITTQPFVVWFTTIIVLGLSIFIIVVFPILNKLVLSMDWNDEENAVRVTDLSDGERFIYDNSGIALSYENQAINEKLESLESPSENVLDKNEYGGYETA